MKSAEEIKKKIRGLQADERLQGGAASVQINAPLALVQVELKATIIALKWVLEE